MNTPKSSQTLIDKLGDLPEEKLAQVEDFVDFLRDKIKPEQLRRAAEAGLLVMPAGGSQRSSVIDSPPVVVPGTPASEIVLQDRR